MRAYDRASLKRTAENDTIRGMIETQDLRRPVQGPQGLPDSWGEFAQAFEEAAQSMARGGQLKSLLRLGRCPRLGIARSFSCGSERPFLQSWCGSPYCPVCAHERAARTMASLRERWEAESRVILVEVPMGARRRVGLSTSESVAAVRAAWAQVTQRVAVQTGLPRLEPLPRVVVHPDGITQFVRLPSLEGGDEPKLLEGVRLACRRIGLRDSSARIVSTTEAIQRFATVSVLEAERFAELVSHDLQRLSALGWRSPFQGDATRDAAKSAAARRWVKLAIDRQRQARRQIFLGSGCSLPTPETRLGEAGAACAAHGRSCRPESLRVRDWSRSGAITWEGEIEHLSAKPTRARVAAFFDSIQASADRRAG